LSPRVPIPAELANVVGVYNEPRQVACDIWIYRGGWVLLARFETEERAARHVEVLRGFR
jgi:hypothetical protein